MISMEALVFAQAFHPMASIDCLKFKIFPLFIQSKRRPDLCDKSLPIYTVHYYSASILYSADFGLHIKNQ